LIRSRTRQEYPHSLSYQEITFTQVPPDYQRPWGHPRYPEEYGLPFEVWQTTSSFSFVGEVALQTVQLRDAFPFKAALFHFFFRSFWSRPNTTRSTTETFGRPETRMGKNRQALPASSGITSLSALGRSRRCRNHGQPQRRGALRRSLCREIQDGPGRWCRSEWSSSYR